MSLTARTTTTLSIGEIRQMILDGLSDSDIQAEDANRVDVEVEAAQSADDYQRSYGDDYDDDTREYGLSAAYSDRLSLGRNDAGEWIGFM